MQHHQLTKNYLWTAFSVFGDVQMKLMAQGLSFQNLLHLSAAGVGGLLTRVFSGLALTELSQSNGRLVLFFVSHSFSKELAVSAPPVQNPSSVLWVRERGLCRRWSSDCVTAVPSLSLSVWLLALLAWPQGITHNSIQERYWGNCPFSAQIFPKEVEPVDFGW